jgi:hypothetical protein
VASPHFGANIASLRHEVAQHHFERSEKHHIAVGDASFEDIQGLRLDLFAKVCYNTNR